MPTEQQKRPNDEDDEVDRRATGTLIVGGGIWLANAMIDAKKSEECFESGRRNCNPISVPDRKAD